MHLPTGSASSAGHRRSSNPPIWAAPSRCPLVGDRSEVPVCAGGLLRSARQYACPAVVFGRPSRSSVSARRSPAALASPRSAGDGVAQARLSAAALAGGSRRSQKWPRSGIVWGRASRRSKSDSTTNAVWILWGFEAAARPLDVRQPGGLPRSDVLAQSRAPLRLEKRGSRVGLLSCVGGRCGRRSRVSCRTGEVHTVLRLLRRTGFSVISCRR
jgi:hypothetical protein